MSAEPASALSPLFLQKFHCLGFDVHTYLARLLVESYTQDALSRFTASNIKITLVDEKNVGISVYGREKNAIFCQILGDFRHRFCHCDRSYGHRTPFRLPFSHLAFANITRLCIQVYEEEPSNSNLTLALGCLSLIELEVVFSSYWVALLIKGWPVQKALRELKLYFGADCQEVPCWYWEYGSCDCPTRCVFSHEGEEEDPDNGDDGSESDDDDCSCGPDTLEYDHDIEDFEEYPWETAVFWEALDRFPKIVSFKLETEYSLKVREHLTTKSSSTELRNSIRVACPTVTHVTIKSLIEGDLFGFAGEIAYDWVEATGQWGIASVCHFLEPDHKAKAVSEDRFWVA